jgi:hypothetical protein
LTGAGTRPALHLLTRFDYPEDAQAFEELVSRLGASEEWSYVEREVDISGAPNRGAGSAVPRLWPIAKEGCGVQWHPGG